MIPKIKRILYATDLSDNSAYAFRYAINEALKHDAEVIILHVFEQMGPASRTMLSKAICPLTSLAKRRSVCSGRGVLSGSER